MAETNSDVGSLYPFIRSQAVQGEFPLSFLQPEFMDAAEWRQRARGKLLELLRYEPPTCDLNPEVVERVQRQGYVREKVYYRTTPDLRANAYLLIPDGLKAPAPGIIALHCHGGFYLWGKEKLVETECEHPVLTEYKQRYYAGRSTASDLARQGYVVIVPEAFYWGERRLILDSDADDWQERPLSLTPERIAEFNQRSSMYEDIVGRTICSAGFTWPGVAWTDDRRAVTYLASRPEVDPDRIGCVGLSMGSVRSAHLAAMDDRIKAAVAVGFMCSYPAQLRSHVRYTIGHTMLVPGLYRLMDYPDVVSMTVPRPLLVINGSQDGLFDLNGVRSALDKLNAVYEKAGAKERIRTRLYDTPHEFNAEMQAEAWDWLARWLKQSNPPTP